MGFTPGGGGGSASIGGSSDVLLSNPVNNQVLAYDNGLWKNQTASGGGDPALGGDLTGTASNAQIATGTVSNAEVASGANIAQSKIANLTADLSAKLNATEKGAANGVASLGSGSTVPISQLTPGVLIISQESAGVYTRPTSRTDLRVAFVGEADPGSTALTNDLWFRRPA